MKKSVSIGVHPWLGNQQRKIPEGVCVINLDHRTDRWKLFEEAWNKAMPGQEVHRISGVPGNSLPGFGEPPLFRKGKRDRNWAGKAGCTLSHRKAIAFAKEQGWEAVLILEDDLHLPGDFGETLLTIEAFLATRPWSVFYAGYTDPVTPFREVGPLSEGVTAFEIHGCNTGHAYLLHQSTFDWILNRLPTEKNIWAWVAIHKVSDRWYRKNLSRAFQVLAPETSLVQQRKGYSDITLEKVLPHEERHVTSINPGKLCPRIYPLKKILRRGCGAVGRIRDEIRGRIRLVTGF